MVVKHGQHCVKGMPLIDSSFYAGFGGDDYAIDASGQHVAIVFGGASTDPVF